MQNKYNFDKRTVWKLINSCNLRYNSQLTYAFKHRYDDDDGRQENVQLCRVITLKMKFKPEYKNKINGNGGALF